MSSNVPLYEQRQVTVEFVAPHFFAGQLYENGQRVTTGENAAKKLIAAGHKAVNVNEEEG